MTIVQENLKYTEDHEWISFENGVGTIGITDFAQKSLGDIVFVELPEVGSRIEKGESFGVVESIKSVNDILAPISGEIIETNEELSDNPELCNSAPYDSWIIKVKLSDEQELNELMDATQYTKKCEDEH